jgi:hypothetical protein
MFFQSLFSEKRDNTQGECHDQADAEWIVIRTQIWGHSDMPFGRPALRAYFVCFSYY